MSDVRFVTSLFPSDLAPGDQRAAALDLASFEVARIRSIDDPLFETVYGLLWAEFGRKHEMELRETLAQRFALAPEMLYELALVRKDGVPAAVRDHTAIPAADEVVVHLSHNLVFPDWRRGGLAGWMRALPVATARELRPGAPITLVAEMEYLDSDDPTREIRLRAYGKAGFKKVDPSVVHYHQPDFRAPEVIDASGGPQPVPFQLVLRQVGNESADTISGARLRSLVAALYEMYGRQFRPQDMRHPALDLAAYPAPDTTIALLPPLD
jgi:hypothetical protein